MNRCSPIQSLTMPNIRNFLRSPSKDYTTYTTFLYNFHYQHPSLTVFSTFLPTRRGEQGWSVGRGQLLEVQATEHPWAQRCSWVVRGCKMGKGQAKI